MLDKPQDRKPGIWRKVLAWLSHEAAVENFRSRFCVHGIVDTGICEQCELEEVGNAKP